ncbi:nicotinamide N-methyltransferase-like isoform X2 [Branchiostoma floridae]|uniref:Nicotinamide N-methyltransferase-like isoform X2 n=2 Tax=Branchiostoma floridae TaxID=7739 RepID=A0A9J7KUM1_BRAFL|nr:nicotinamide N-methyltransferase-like isoform X2 [Branchiostoma floridae]
MISTFVSCYAMSGSSCLRWKMAAPIQRGTDHHKTFGAKAYLALYYATPEGTDEEGELLTPYLKEFHEIFNSGRLKPGSRLLDVGSGPTIHQLISASRFCTEIVCAEYTENNRAEIEKWVKKDPDMHDWTPFFKFVADLEGDSSSWEARQSHLRDAIKEVITCDVTKPEPFAPRQYQEFDVITTSLSLETACPDRETYSAAVRNITRLLKPGGTFVLIGVTNQTFYTVGGYKFFTLPIDSSFMREVFEKAGFVDINIKSFPATNPENNTISDFDGFVVLHACKAEI